MIEDLQEERARILLEDVERRTRVTPAELERTAKALFSISHSEMTEVVQMATKNAAEQNRNGKEGEPRRMLTVPQVRELALEYFRAEPEATSQECYDAVSKHGDMACKFRSFASFVCPAVRKQLGIDVKAAWLLASSKKAAPPRKNGSAPKAAPPAPTTKRAPGEVLQKPVQEMHTPAAAEPPRDDRDRIALETPGGKLTARHEGAGTWHVEFAGAVQAEVVHLLVADLVGPFTSRREAAAS